MLILQAPANAGVRTVTGLWKFKNEEKHEDGIDFNELCSVGSKIAAGSRGFPGNLCNIYAVLSDDEELAFQFRYQPDNSEHDVSADNLQPQFADFFAKHTHAFIGWEVTSDKTPEAKVEIAPLPRSNGYWNNLPLTVYSNNEAVDGNEVLNAWGLESWGRKLPSDSGDYVGWQRVGLPKGWTIVLEAHGLILVDNYNQVRGSISDVFERPPNRTFVITDPNNEGQKKKRPKPKVKKPSLRLNTSIKFGESSSFGDEGTYDFWVENAVGEHLFGIHQQPVTDDKYNEMIPYLRQRIFDWLEEHYPDWQNHHAYWDVFPQEYAKWGKAMETAYAVASALINGKSDEELHQLRAEISVGEQYTNYTLALQERLSEHFDEKTPYKVANAVVRKILDICNLRIGRIDD